VRAPIQEFVNESFRPVMTGDVTTGQAEYSDLEEHWPADPNQPAVVLPADSTALRRRARSRKRRSISALRCGPARNIEWLIRESGCRCAIRKIQSKRVPIAARTFREILFRRFTNFGHDLTRTDYVRSLEDALGSRHLLVGLNRFHEPRGESKRWRSALTAVEWRRRRALVFATLRGSMFAIEDERLFPLQTGSQPPTATVLETPETLARSSLTSVERSTLLADLHRGRNSRPIADTVDVGPARSDPRAHAGFALRPAGHQVLANVNRIADLARNFEFSGGISFSRLRR